MSWFGLFEDSPKEVGNKLLSVYYDEGSKFGDLPGTYEAWIATVEGKVTGFVELVGELVISNSASTSVDQAADRLYQLANQSEGRATLPQIVQVAGGSGDTVNWWAMVPEVGLETVSDVAELAAETAQNIGTGVLGTVNLVKFLPIIALGAGALYIYVSASKGKGLRGIFSND